MNMLKPVLSYCLASCLLAVASRAQAEDGSSPWSGAFGTRRVALEAQSGLVGPSGLAGVAIDITPMRYVSINAAAGYALDGPQLAVMPRLRLEIEGMGPWPVALTLGLGYSTGSNYGTVDKAAGAVGHGHSEFGGSYDLYHYLRWERAHWINTELGVEVPLSAAWCLRGFVGVATMANPKDGVRGSVMREGADSRGNLMQRDNPGEPGPYTGIALALTLPLGF